MRGGQTAPATVGKRGGGAAPAQRRNLSPAHENDPLLIEVQWQRKVVLPAANWPRVMGQRSLPSRSTIACLPTRRSPTSTPQWTTYRTPLPPVRRIRMLERMMKTPGLRFTQGLATITIAKFYTPFTPFYACLRPITNHLFAKQQHKSAIILIWFWRYHA